MPKTNYGYIEPKRKPEDYVLGASSLPLKEINPSGDWRAFLPIYEPQAENFETYGCTVWGTQNLIEIYIKYITGNEPNYSERFNYNLSEINPYGANPFDVAYAIHKYGLIDSEILPMTSTLEEFKTPRPMSKEYLDKAQKFLDRFIFKYEFVNTSISQALKISPLGVAVPAWHIDSEGKYYRPQGVPDNHWCALVAEEGDCWIIFDSYDHSIKKLRKDANITTVMRIYVEEKPVEIKKLGFWRWLLEVFFRQKLIFRAFKLNLIYENK